MLTAAASITCLHCSETKSEDLQQNQAKNTLFEFWRFFCLENKWKGDLFPNFPVFFQHLYFSDLQLVVSRFVPTCEGTEACPILLCMLALSHAWGVYSMCQQWQPCQHMSPVASWLLSRQVKARWLVSLCTADKSWHGGSVHCWLGGVIGQGNFHSLVQFISSVLICWVFVMGGDSKTMRERESRISHFVCDYFGNCITDDGLFLCHCSDSGSFHFPT